MHRRQSAASKRPKQRKLELVDVEGNRTIVEIKFDPSQGPMLASDVPNKGSAARRCGHATYFLDVTRAVAGQRRRSAGLESVANNRKKRGRLPKQIAGAAIQDLDHIIPGPSEREVADVVDPNLVSAL